MDTETEKYIKLHEGFIKTLQEKKKGLEVEIEQANNSIEVFRNFNREMKGRDVQEEVFGLLGFGKKNKSKEGK